MVRPRFFQNRVSSSQLAKMMAVFSRIDAMIAEYSVTIAASGGSSKIKRDAWRNVGTLGGGLSTAETQPVLFRDMVKKVEIWSDVRRSLGAFEQSRFVNWDVVDYLKKMRDALACDVAEYKDEGLRQAQLAVEALLEIKTNYETPFPLDGEFTSDTKERLLTELRAEVVKAHRRISMIRDAMSGVDDLYEICKFIQITRETGDK